ncbi:SWIM zinc finger family protein [Phycicoccus flavus]|uniref:SWIM zinc finger family protein n=1 Tax=Phycicoccus flavus TaxID=2502783 RepID=A0A8T6R6E0_9MICO|nr:SWIM zinc finger family protein [Phycicoccus flavus]NHA69322.1 SWIM zinc finger family protein [Phycicoccus flavus]
MTRWTHQRVLDAAPDAASVSSARALARPGPWSDTGATEHLLWGRCQGSGRTPYQVSIDLDGPAYRCSCPSRKFPCKHALALLLLWSGGGDVAAVSEPSDFAGEWAAARAGRVAAAAAAPAKAAPDPEARARRVEERVATMTAGLEEFGLWLADLVRGGTAAARSRDASYWDGAAARLVDGQCPALAADVRDAGSAAHRREDWNEHLLRRAGRWWTIVGAWGRREDLSADHRADLRTALGWAYATEEVRGADEVTDRWLVLGSHRSDDGRLQEQRTWFRGLDTGETLVVLDFAGGGQPLPVAQLTGAVVEATLARYPGSAPRRALLVDDPVPLPDADLPAPAGVGLVDGLDAAARLRAGAPLVRRVPLLLDDVRVGVDDVVDADGRALRLVAGRDPWPVLAATGGRPTRCFGEWEDDAFRPLAVHLEDRWAACE